MAIRVIDDEPEVKVTADELRRYKDEYEKAYMHYAGKPPSLETFIRGQRAAKYGL